MSLQMQGEFLLYSSVASSTRATYLLGSKRWERFCAAQSLTAYPASEHGLFYFVASMASQLLSYPTATCYLAGIAFFHNVRGLTCDWNSMPQLQRALQGLKRLKPRSRVNRSPITLGYMAILKKSIARSLLSPYDQHWES